MSRRHARRCAWSSSSRTSTTSRASPPTSTSPRSCSPRSPGDRPGDRPRDCRTGIRDRRVESGARAGGRARRPRHAAGDGLVPPPAPALPERLLAIPALVDELIALHSPRIVAIERLFFSKNVQTAFAVGQARGVVLLAAAQAEVPARAATPTEAKGAVRGPAG